MNKIKIHFKNCYGIKSLEQEFDFTASSTFALYAPNGVMKTSFAKTFQDISNKANTNDRIFKDRPNERQVTDQSGNELAPENIFVIEPYNEGYKSDRISTLLVNKTLKDEFDEINRSISALKENLINELKVSSGVKNGIEELLAETITHDPKEFYTALNRVKSEVLANKEPQLAEVVYQKINNDKVADAIKDPAFRAKLIDYINTYDKLLTKSTFFRKGIFNHNNAAEIAKNLKDNGFFQAEHSVVVTADGKKQEIKTENDLVAVIQQEKDSILTNPALLKAFDEVDKKLDKNKELREFREYIEQNKDLIPELNNLELLKSKIWIAYLAKSVESYKTLMAEYEKAEVRVKEIIEKAKAEATRWREVIEIFNNRFFVPFRVSMDNQARVILNSDAPSLSFEFEDDATGATVPVGEKDLVRVLSNGERRALYILNIIFEVEARKSSETETLFIVDDIADSFDYKNKYAIIEYLSEINKFPHFRQIVLTHNFDFYRTIAGRLSLPRPYHLHTIKSDLGIKIVQEHYQNNPFTEWKKHLHTNTAMLIASIPFVRNLAEFCGNPQEFLKLTSLLHIKTDTDSITVKDLEDVFKSILKDKSSLSLPNPSQRVKELIYLTADSISKESIQNIDLEKKIVLSVAIRLKCEEYMIHKINDATAVTDITKHQTIALIEIFKKRFPNDLDAIGLVEQVNLMTPENIHLNSFMYEPILDMANDHLKQLYQKVCSSNCNFLHA